MLLCRHLVKISQMLNMVTCFFSLIWTIFLLYLFIDAHDL